MLCMPPVFTSCCTALQLSSFGRVCDAGLAVFNLYAFSVSCNWVGLPHALVQHSNLTSCVAALLGTAFSHIASVARF